MLKLISIYSISDRYYLEQNHRILLMKSIHRVQQSLRKKKWPALPVYLYDFHNSGELF